MMTVRRRIKELQNVEIKLFLFIFNNHLLYILIIQNNPL